ncbi:hypothetical protein HN747_01335 [archaeon]|jgi:hypothetical protein|nr:hypothetical protein [archaeon]
MAKKKGRNPNNVLFLEALLMALFIFGIGIVMGIFIEDVRSDRVTEGYFDSQVNLLDMQTLSDLISTGDYSCEYRREKNIDFGNKIYEDALKFSEYEEAQTFGDSLESQHRIYDLLRTIFWVNSLELKDDCGEMNIIVYLYNYDEKDAEEKQKQEVFSRFAGELKSEMGENTVLIPIAMNLGIESLNVLKESYGIVKTSIIINEKTVLDSIEDLNEFN